MCTEEHYRAQSEEPLISEEHQPQLPALETIDITSARKAYIRKWLLCDSEVKQDTPHHNSKYDDDDDNDGDDDDNDDDGDDDDDDDDGDDDDDDDDNDGGDDDDDDDDNNKLL